MLPSYIGIISKTFTRIPINQPGLESRRCFFVAHVVKVDADRHSQMVDFA